ncbi:MAG: hypothetical protein JRJ39_02020 [Deltaproteobacteria bacterium]|nr:hypothetical protein [Deltaproteobacteria bacterium]MBW2363840.1 hypothetical protein [Deltaproteobacteria bacterium]
MKKLSGTDTQRMIQVFENELNMIHGVSVIEKMQYRRKIMNVLMPALAVNDVKVEAVIDAVEQRLGDVLKIFQDGDNFKEKLRRELTQKLR